MCCCLFCVCVFRSEYVKCVFVCLWDSFRDVVGHALCACAIVVFVCCFCVCALFVRIV